MVTAPFSTPTLPQVRPTRPPVSSPSVAANRRPCARKQEHNGNHNDYCQASLGLDCGLIMQGALFQSHHAVPIHRLGHCQSALGLQTKLHMHCALRQVSTCSPCIFRHGTLDTHSCMAVHVATTNHTQQPSRSAPNIPHW